MSRTYRAVGVLFLLNGAFLASWLSRIPAVRERLALNDRTLGLLLLASAVGGVVAMRLTPRLIAWQGSDRGALWGGLAMAAVLWIPGAAPSIAVLAPALLALGAASGVMNICMNAEGMSVERSAGRPRLSGLHGLFSLGNLMGAAVGTGAARLDLAPVWHLVAVGLIGAPGVFWAGWTLQHDGRPSIRRVPHISARFTRPIMLLGLLSFCASVGEGAMADWVAIYMRERLHTSMALAASTYTAFCVAMGIGRFVGDPVTARLGAVQGVRAGGLMVALGLTLGLALDTVPCMIAAVILVGIGLALVTPMAIRAAGSQPDVSPGPALAALAAVGTCAFFVGPPTIGFISHLTSLRLALGVVALLALGVVALAPVVRVPPRNIENPA